jgi:hypothetical protein
MSSESSKSISIPLLSNNPNPNPKSGMVGSGDLEIPRMKGELRPVALRSGALRAFGEFASE